MRYDGGKGQAGVYQRLISMMPPHDVYIETHLGGGNLLERKKPAAESIGVDVDDQVIALWRSRDFPATFVQADAVTFLRAFDFAGRRVLVYADPPYVRSARRSAAALYRHEYTDEQHHELLNVLRELPALVMLSGYRCELYDAALARWHRDDYLVQTRIGLVNESVWCNFEPAAELHDYRYIGSNFRERERIKRKPTRWLARFAKLPPAERLAMLEVLLELSARASTDPASGAAGVVRAPRRRFMLDKLPDAFPWPDPLAASDDGDVGIAERGEVYS